MNESKISEKNFAMALKDNKYFRNLSPADMLSVMIKEIIAKGSINITNFEYWKELGNTVNEVGDEEKFDHIIEILNMKAPSSTLKILYDTGLMEYCLPICFPIKKSISRRDFESIIEKFDKCGQELPVRITVFLFPFEVDKVQETLQKANFNPEIIKMMLSALKDIEDFVLIKEKEKLKKFIFRKGWDYYYFIDSFAKQLNLTLEFPEYKRLSKQYLVEEIKKHHEPIFPDDLKIRPSDLIESGITKEGETEEMMKMLAEHCHLKPYDNRKDMLLKRAEELKKSKLKRVFRNVMWIR